MNNAQVGDVIYMAHPEMDHGTRPMIVMGMDANQLMLMPMSHTPLYNGQQPIKGWKKVNYFAANRVFAIGRNEALCLRRGRPGNGPCSLLEIHRKPGDEGGDAARQTQGQRPEERTPPGLPEA